MGVFMLWNCLDGRRFCRAFVPTCIALVLVSSVARLGIAQSCKVVHHPPASDADTAFLAGDFAKAAGLYKSALGKDAGDQDATIGLVHALLRQFKVQEAADALKAYTKSPEPPALMTLRGEVELRQGEPWTSVKTAAASQALDPCNPRNLFLLSRLADLNSQFAMARKTLTAAHKIDSEDPEIRAEWIKTLPIEQRITEWDAYLAASMGESADERTNLQTDLNHLKAWAAGPRGACTMVSTVANAEIPFVPIVGMGNTHLTIAFGLPVKINNHETRLVIDTSYNPRLPIEGGSGILISKAAAHHAGVAPIYQNDVPGTGGQAPRSGFVGIADSISVGDVEFHNCAVQAMDVNFPNGAEGIVGLEVLSPFLTTLDFQAKKLILETLPARPKEMTATDGLYNRFWAPSMKDYTPMLTSGSDMILPVSVNGSPLMPFVLDTAISYSAVTPQAASLLTTGHKDLKLEDRKAMASWNVITLTGDQVLNFAGVSLKESPIVPFPTEAFTDDSGIEIFGLIGLKTISRTTIHIDYRDGLVKFDYDPARKSPFLF
jgi:hypothetical protein